MDIRLCPRCGRGEMPPATRCRDCGVALTVHDEQSLIGQMLGNYRIERVIGAGGMGVVFGARHVTLLREAAIKVLQPSLDPGGTGQSEFAQRFLREARLLAALEHRNIVGIYDFDVSPMGFPYLVMPWLRGESLRQLMQRHPYGIARGWIGTILDDIAAGLSHAHRHGVVHRDLKPENVFLTLTADGARAVLLDFGIAHAGERVGDLARTATGTVMGTPLYQAPEQLRAENVSAATDQYSLALLVAEMLRGQPVRQGRSYTDIVTRDAQAPLPRDALPEDLDAPLYAALERATAPQPEDRHADIATFRAALHFPTARRDALGIAIDDGSSATPLTVVVSPPRESSLSSPPSLSSPTVSTPPPVMRSRRGVMGIAAAAVLVAVVAAAWWIHDRIPRIETPGALSIPTAATPATTDTRWLREGERIALAPGTQAPLLQVGNTVVMRSAAGWSLLDLESKLGAGQVPLASGEALLGVDDVQHLWIARRGGIDALEPIKGRRDTLIDDARFVADAQGSETAIAPSGRWIAHFDRDGRFVVKHRTAGGFEPWLSEEAKADGRATFRLDDRHAVVVRPNGTLQVFDLDARRRLWSAAYPAFRVFDVAMDAEQDRLVVAGDSTRLAQWRLSDGKPLASIDLPRPAQALLWLGDGEHLLVADAKKIALWRITPNGGESLQEIDGGADWLFRGERTVLAGDDRSLRSIAFGAIPQRLVRTDIGEIWAAAARDGAVYAGGSQGELARIDARDGSVERRSIHSAGIPDLHFFQDRLVSSSDDRTLAVWRLPTLDVEWRAKGHAFLVNQLASGRSLWSSSSDGSVRRWNWPELESVEAIDLRQRFGKDLELHAFWVSPDDTELLVGTWADRLVHLRRDGATWRMSSAAVEAHVGYRMVDLPNCEAVLVVGVNPGRLMLFDRRDGHLEQLPRDSHTFYAATPDGSGAGVWLGGAAELAHLSLRREGGHFRAEIGRRQASALGVSGALARLPGNGTQPATLFSGNDRGEVAFYPEFPNDASPETALSSAAAAFVEAQ